MEAKASGFMTPFELQKTGNILIPEFFAAIELENCLDLGQLQPEQFKRSYSPDMVDLPLLCRLIVGMARCRALAFRLNVVN